MISDECLEGDCDNCVAIFCRHYCHDDELEIDAEEDDYDDYDDPDRRY